MKNKSKKGFTLVEVLIVSSIISILAGYSIMKLTSSTDVAEKTSLRLELKSICSLQEIHFRRNLDYASSLEELKFKTAFEEEEINYVVSSHKCSNNLNSYVVEGNLLKLEKNNQLFLDGCTCLISENDVVEPEVVVVPVEPEVVVPVEPEVVEPVEPEVVVPVEPEVVVPVEPEIVVEDIKTIEDYVAGNYSSNSKFDFLYCPNENYVNFQGLKYCFKNYVGKATTEGDLIAMVYQDVNISIPIEVAAEIIKLNSIKFLINTDSDSLSALTSLKEIKSIINVDINSVSAKNVLNNLTYIEEIFLTNVPSTYNWRDAVPKETIRLDKNSYICLNFSKLKVKVKTTRTSSRTVSYTEICEN